MRPKFPHILQTVEWGIAKCNAQPGWSWSFFVKDKESKQFRQVAERFSEWEKTESTILVLEKNLGMGQKLIYIPRGPFLDWQNRDEVLETLTFLKKLSIERNALFLRFEPDVFEQEFPYIEVKRLGFYKTKDFVQAQDTVKISIDKNDEDLMNSFHQKHRYNIRLAQKRGLTVRSSLDMSDLEIFYELTKKTDERSGGAINPHPIEYYKTIVEVLGKYGMAKIYIVEKGGVPASASIVFIYGEEVIYMFGASDYEFRRDMPNHLREWQSMRDARDAGCKQFDLWGITMRKDPEGGIKRYKLGYNEKCEKMAGTFDFAPNWLKYHLFDLLNKIRRKL